MRKVQQSKHILDYVMYTSTWVKANIPIVTLIHISATKQNNAIINVSLGQRRLCHEECADQVKAWFTLCFQNCTQRHVNLSQ